MTSATTSDSPLRRLRVPLSATTSTSCLVGWWVFITGGAREARSGKRQALERLAMAVAPVAVVPYSSIGYRFPTAVSPPIRCASSSLPNSDMRKEGEQEKKNSRTALVVHAAGSNIEGRRKGRRRDWSVSSTIDESDIIPLLHRADSTNSKSSLAGVGGGRPRDDLDRLVDRTINATVALAAGSFAITKLLTIDHDYWHGWTLFEILRYAPQHNWTAYEEALKTNPVLSKMMISGIVYSLGDWIAQCYEGKPLLEIDRTRIFRSGLVGFTLHGSLSHYYYNVCEAIFPFDAWWVVPAKVAFDQTLWCALWNSIYFVVLGFLRLEAPVNIYRELTKTFWPLLTAGWKLWPFAHLITYGVVPVEQRLLWVDCVELVWVTILSTYSNEKSDVRNSEVVSDVKS